MLSAQTTDLPSAQDDISVVCTDTRFVACANSRSGSILRPTPHNRSVVCADHRRELSWSQISCCLGARQGPIMRCRCAEIYMLPCGRIRTEPHFMPSLPSPDDRTTLYAPHFMPSPKHRRKSSINLRADHFSCKTQRVSTRFHYIACN